VETDSSEEDGEEDATPPVEAIPFFLRNDLDPPYNPPTYPNDVKVDGLTVDTLKTVYKTLINRIHNAMLHARMKTSKRDKYKIVKHPWMRTSVAIRIFG